MKLFFGEIFPQVKINEEEQQHIVKVLRMKQGEQIFVTDGNGNLAKGNLIFEGKKLNLEVSEIQENLPDFSTQLHIAIAPTKNIDRIEFFVEKAVEMGISEITFLQTEKTERKNISIEKLTKQAISASKQSLRFHFPKLNDLVKFSDFIKNLDTENTFVAHCNEKLERIDLSLVKSQESRVKNQESRIKSQESRIKSQESRTENQDVKTVTSKENSVLEKKNAKITFLIGPEGDFSDKEIQILVEKGIKAVSLGSQRLRTETAGIFVAAWNYNAMW